MKFNGADSIKVDSSSTGFTVYNSANNLINSGLKAFQIIADTIRYISCSFLKNSDTSITFVLGTYDTTKLLIIDPIIFSSYIGFDRSHDRLHAIRVNDDNIVYMSGITTINNNLDVFLVKYDPVSCKVNYTILGSTQGNDGLDQFALSENGKVALAIDREANVYLTGYIGGDDFPLTSTTFHTINHSATNSIFFAKFDRNNHLKYSGYYGIINEGKISSSGIAIDKSGNVYVSGHFLHYPSNPNTWSFILKLNASCTELIFDEIISGQNNGGNVIITDIALKSNNNIYIYGCVEYSNIIINNTSYTNSNSNPYHYDAFLFELAHDGSTVINYKFLGDKHHENISQDYSNFRMILDANDNVYLTGSTWSLETGMTSLNFWDGGAVIGRGKEGFLIKINSSDFSFAFKKTFGGIYDDWGYSIALDKNNNIYIIGETTSEYGSTTAAFPFTNYYFYNYYQHYENVHTGATFLIIFDNNGQNILFSSFLNISNFGYTTYLAALDVCVDKNGKVYIVGTTEANNFLTINPIKAKHLSSEGWDGFLMILTPFPDPIIVK
jgi:hypothetical protein